MNPERHERVKKLFLAACELAETARQAFIERACGDDAEIRREVESLLRYHRDETVLERSRPPQPAGGKAETLATEPGLEGITPLPLSSGRPPRYVAGTVVAGRFRIVTLLGQGGMGEVYRAEDLHLHRTVALKFLTGSRATDPVWLARFYNEARLSLTVTNPHVCRVYDIGRADDEAFICMEYVDGEDLASLLKRIGRLTAEKVVDIARQLCHGLGAAHAMGVLHRDLKPANIMLDGRGHVRITDFGIAALVTPGSDTPIPAGTPGYMAPELLRGKAATVRSDLYALGLVLYEMLTGRKASRARGPDGDEQRTAVVPPSHVIEDVDPALEQAILRCAAESPEDRPSSVYEVLALLPGGDPLAAALAAGEIPAPELLAAVSAASKPPLIVARICLAVSVAGLALAVVLAGRTTLFAQAGLTKPPEVLDEIAREIVASLGGPDHGKVTSGRFFINPRFSHSPGDTPATPGAQSQGGIGGSPMVFYEYPLPGGRDERVEAFVRLEPTGKLMTYRVPPVWPAETGPRPVPVNWATIFAKAGLELEKFRRIARFSPPPVFADEVLGWELIHDDSTAESMQVSAAALEGRVVYFNASDIPTTAHRPIRGDASTAMKSTRLLMPMFLATFVGALILAWRNLRLGLGDRRAASRLAVCLFGVEMLQWWAGQGFLPRPLIDVDLLANALRTACFSAVAVWFYYLALEPYVRKFWPHALLSWSRIVVGRGRDPLLGRDILLGITFGVAVVVVGQCGVLLSAWAGRPSPPLWLPGADTDLGRPVGFGYITSTTALALRIAIGRAMIFLMLMTLLRKIIRIPWLATLTFVLIATAYTALNAQATTVTSWLIGGIVAVAVADLLLRAGLLAVCVTLFVIRLLLSNPITVDLHVWYASTSTLVLAMIAGLLAFGVYAAFRLGPHPEAARG